MGGTKRIQQVSLSLLRRTAKLRVNNEWNMMVYKNTVSKWEGMYDNKHVKVIRVS